MDIKIELIKKGKDCLEQKDYKEAEAIFEEALRLDPKNEQAYFELGKIFCIYQKYSEAVEYLKKAIALNPDNACAHFLLAKAYKGQGMHSDSVREFQKTLELNCRTENIHFDSIDEQAYFELGSIYFTEGKYSEAVEKLEKAININPGYIFARLLLAKSYKAIKRFQDAIKEFTEVLKLGYENAADIHRELFAIYRALNDFDLAAGELKKALEKGYSKELYQSDLESLYRGQMRLIQTYNCQGKYLEAMQESERAANFISKESLMYKNMLQNEIDISQRNVSLSCRIRALTVTLTNKCNLSCIMCKSISKPWDLPGESIPAIIALFPYLERLMWQGGEVFLYPGFKELLKEASRFPMRQIIATNGHLIDAESAEIMVRSKVELTFSIDGATKDVYEHIRRGGQFEKVISNLNLVNELRQKLNPDMQTRLNVLVMRSNYHQVEQFLDFAKQYKFNTVFFNSTGKDFENLKENVFCFSRDEEVLIYLNRIRARIAKTAQDYGIRLENWLPSLDFIEQTQNQLQEYPKASGEEPKGDKTNTLPCHVPWQRMYIDCGGSVRPDCLCPTDKSVGSIIDNTLEEMWNNDKMKEYRQRIIDNNYKDFCNPDCVFGRVAEKNLKSV